MGMYDYVRCKYPLPIDGANDLEYQTKDTDEQYLELYEIREDGTLWLQEYEIEDRSDKSLPEGSFGRLRGCMTKVNKRFIKQEFTGEIRFYTTANEIGYEWLEFSAYFVDGVLKHMEKIEAEKILETGE